jgi:hypothetical protein
MVGISTTISIVPTVSIPAVISIVSTISITPLIISAISACVALQASIDILDSYTAALKVAELGRLPSTIGIFAAGIQRRSTCINVPARLLVRT